MMKNNLPKNILQINIGQVYGGVSTMLFNIYKEINKEKIQFDFVAPRKTSFEKCRTEINEMGGNIVELDTKGWFIKRKLQFFLRLSKQIKSKEYTAVHCNSGSIFFNIQVAFISKICGIEKVIIHSHNAGNDSKPKILFGKFIRPLISVLATDLLACSDEAAKFMFPTKIISKKEYRIISNGIDTYSFKFSNSERAIIREKLGFADEKILLHVGRFTKQKNHEYLIELFSSLNQINDEFRLLLVGEGELKSKIQHEVIQLNLKEKVKFLGMQNNIASIMSASDLLLLPSLYEGLPVVGVEAQANGLPCIFSSNITKEVDLINSNNDFLGLSGSKDYWLKKILSRLEESEEKLEERSSCAKKIDDLGFSIKEVAHELENIYLN